MRRRFHTLDVFTHRRFAGNPLAVVHDAAGLDTAAMQRIAREFNLSETVFVLPETKASHRADIRIFTPAAELPFAGHPTVGTAVLLALLDGLKPGGAADFTLGLVAGPVPCALSADERGASATFVAPKPAVEIGPAPPAEALAKILGLSVHDIGAGVHHATRFAAPVDYLLAPLASRASLSRIAVDGKLLDETLRALGANHPAIYAYCLDPADPAKVHARMFAPGLGVPEDPATGSAAATFVGVMEKFGGLADGVHAFTIRQGEDMGRPSDIGLEITMAAGKATRARIGGGAVVVSEGTIEA